jgi:hypothetical protein
VLGYVSGRVIGGHHTYFFSLDFARYAIRVDIVRMIAFDDPHHITQCGNRRQQTFFCDNDYKRYIGLMLHGVKSRKERYGHIL